MTATTVDVSTFPDGTLVIHPSGVLGLEASVELRRTLVQAIRHTRPVRLVIDLADVAWADSINLGTLAAAYDLGTDQRIAVFLDHPAVRLADMLTAAGVPPDRLRHVGGIEYSPSPPGPLPGARTAGSPSPAGSTEAALPDEPRSDPSPTRDTTGITEV